MLEYYIIVGKQIDDEDIKYLHSDETVDKNPEKNGIQGTPLTVEFIGKTMVELSQKPPLDESDDNYKGITNLIKEALTVKGPDGHDPDDPELEKIWEKTTVHLKYDERKRAPGETDENTRTLVVPVKDTLVYRQDILAAEGTKIGFKPPLTYELDRLLMKEYFSTLIHEIIEEFQDSNGQALSTEIQESLLAKVNKKLGAFAELTIDAEEPAEQNMVEILQSPVSAFHRAVGIYITNMCN